MKILLAIWSLASENGGPTRSTIGLSLALSKAGANVTLFSNVPGTVSPETVNILKAAGVNFREGRGNSYFTALNDSRMILREVHPDVVHVQGLWKLSSHAMNVAARHLGVPIVISPRGMLDPWALGVKKWKKKVGMLLYQKRDLKYATAFHATATVEAENIRNFGLSQQIYTIPNGVSVPEQMPSIGDSTNMHTALFLSRLHPGKGLLLLAEAWARVRPKGWRMVVVGGDVKNHRVQVETRLKVLRIDQDWEFTGELDDIKKWEAFAAADLFIHPSASENFGISIAEALSAGVPVITTKGCPWAEIDGYCGWWIDRSVDALTNAMKLAITMSDEERGVLGEKGKRLIRAKFTWPAIGAQMSKVYAEIIQNNG